MCMWRDASRVRACVYLCVWVCMGGASPPTLVLPPSSLQAPSSTSSKFFYYFFFYQYGHHPVNSCARFSEDVASEINRDTWSFTSRPGPPLAAAAAANSWPVIIMSHRNVRTSA